MRKPNGYWTYEKCLEEAKKYTTLTDFDRNSHGAYNAAQRKGWIKDYTWLKQLHKSRNYWNFEHCLEAAKKCKTMKEFAKKYGTACLNARKNDWLKQYTWLEKRRDKWNYDTCFEEAKKYKYQTEFHKNCGGAFKVAWENDWLKDYTWFGDGNKIYAEVKRKWNQTTCYELALKCESRADMKNQSSAAYNVARENGWIDDYTWFSDGHKLFGEKKTIWTYDKCLEESKKYKSRSEFCHKCSGGYARSLEKGWINDFSWLKNEHVFSDEVDCVYGYFFENNVVYIGRTLMRLKKARHQQHLTSNSDAVFKYSKENDVTIPDMTVLEDNLTLEDGSKKEGIWLEYFKNKGYKILNRCKTGGLGAIGLGKWSKRKCLEEAKKYKTRIEFYRNSKKAYVAASKYGWLNDYTWMGNRRRSNGFWDQDKCFQEAKKYKTRTEFSKKAGAAYKLACMNGWIEEYDWLNIKSVKWNYETCFKEAQKYSSRTEFERNNGSAYTRAKKNDWLKDYTWFVQFRKPNGYWNYETCLIEAKKYNTRTDFNRHCGRGYSVALENGWLDDYTWMQRRYKSGESKDKAQLELNFG